jgi:hypothetical protein
VGQVRALPVRGVRLKDAVDGYLATIPSANTRRGYAIALNQLVRDFGADSDAGLLEAERVGGWFTLKWGRRSAQTFNVPLASLRGACEYWCKQEWRVGDPLVRLVPRKALSDHSRAVTRDEVTGLLAADVPRGRRCCGRCCMRPPPAPKNCDARHPGSGPGEPVRHRRPQGRRQGCGRLADGHRAAAAPPAGGAEEGAGVPDRPQGETRCGRG